jgi:putative glycosyltransferase
MKLSIVATLYKSEKYISEFCQRIASTSQKLVGASYEIILVNDGSPDNSLETAIKMIEIYPCISVVDLSRNFGHHRAMMTGLAHATGEKIFLIDSDLEEEPEWLTSFSSQMEDECCDVVYGIQETRKGGIFERYSGEMFYRLLQMLAKERIPVNIVVARLMTKRYVDALLLHKEREIYIAGLWHITGFKQRSQIVKKHGSSESTYTLGRKLSLLINSITSFSNLPLIGIFYFGLVVMMFACSYSTYLVINKFFFHAILSGWTSVMASIWLLGGLVISFIGIVGIYLSKIFIEIKNRPYTILRQIYKNKLNTATSS